MSFEIKLNEIGYKLKVSAMGVAGENLEDNVDNPEITANMKTLEKYIENYSEFSQALTIYKSLVEEDVRQLYNVQKTISYVDRQLLE